MSVIQDHGTEKRKGDQVVPIKEIQVGRLWPPVTLGDADFGDTFLLETQNKL